MTRNPELIFLCLAVMLFPGLLAQSYTPPVGQPGTSAMHKDSSAFVSWASACRISRGYQDSSNPSLGKASVGDSTMATGKAQSNGIVSLGDGGTALCTFPKPLKNGPGYDFAVFENGFDDTFLELAFVEVSSDGLNFVRFPAHSLTDTVTQTGTFGSTDATKINNLAGKYRGGYGTPFDLSELAGKPGLDINAVTHVRVVDVVGSLNSAFATRDSYGRKVNDPWPTAFASGGFDLDAIGVIHEDATVGIRENSLESQVRFYPNPVGSSGTLKIDAPFLIEAITVFDVGGRQVVVSEGNVVLTHSLSAGVYLVHMVTEKGSVRKKVIVQ